MAILQIWERLSGKEISKRAYFNLVIVAFTLVACFQAWKDKNDEAVYLKTNIANLNGQIGGLNTQLKDLKAEFDTLHKPILTGHIEQTVISDLVKGGTQLTILVTIANTGTPSVARGFFLSIEGDSWAVPFLRPTAFREPYVMRDTAGKVIFKYTRDDALYEKTAKPVERGGSVSGWLVFMLPDVGFDKFAHGVKLTLDFHDIFNNQYRAIHQTGTNISNRKEPQAYCGVK